MSTRDPEDGLRKTRRSLTIASVILILITVAGIDVTKIRLPWIEGTVDRPEYIYLGLWLAFSYWLIAYLQFLFSSTAASESYKLVRVATEERVRKKLQREYSELIEKRRARFQKPYTGAVIEINFFGDWIAVFRARSIQHTNKYRTSANLSDWEDFHDVNVDRRTVAWAKFRAFFATLTKSPILWDYVPLFLALAAAGCGAYEFAIYMRLLAA